ncbi:sarcosine oxidase subunit gamma [Acuticoccus mangrovi]|uniref:Sarcosine oxidase subunit gamma n=1 Tax=Acuticoccus mangrovi TaxID=2796142 RepID=A0A934IL53_9HYPH|nr:sarcosine oxidase subunit gamma family protein [Acuticoccus mangrovi]MBJ3775817.1 hypothetical protein [Acuticoccus mangrovi]
MSERMARPLDGHAFRPAPRIAVTERPIASLVQVAAFPGMVEMVNAALATLSLPPLPAPTRATPFAGGVVMDAGPARALVESERPLFAALDDAVPKDAGTVTDLSHGRICVSVAGPRAAWVLAKGVAVDLHDSAFPVDATAWTTLDHMGVVLRRSAPEAFDLYPYRGFGRSLAAWLETAAAEDGR